MARGWGGRWRSGCRSRGGGSRGRQRASTGRGAGRTVDEAGQNQNRRCYFHCSRRSLHFRCRCRCRCQNHQSGSRIPTRALVRARAGGRGAADDRAGTSAVRGRRTTARSGPCWQTTLRWLRAPDRRANGGRAASREEWGVGGAGGVAGTAVAVAAGCAAAVAAAAVVVIV